jgi:hypothetical protein
MVKLYHPILLVLVGYKIIPPGRRDSQASQSAHETGIEDHNLPTPLPTSAGVNASYSGLSQSEPESSGTCSRSKCQFGGLSKIAESQ